jgi:hypothetical protein
MTFKSVLFSLIFLSMSTLASTNNVHNKIDCFSEDANKIIRIMASGPNEYTISSNASVQLFEYSESSQNEHLVRKTSTAAVTEYTFLNSKVNEFKIDQLKIVLGSNGALELYRIEGSDFFEVTSTIPDFKFSPKTEFKCTTFQQRSAAKSPGMSGGN